VPTTVKSSPIGALCQSGNPGAHISLGAKLVDTFAVVKIRCI